ncbi:hypothetical protein CASFOL_018984 [Castilleja foliolosa]|uniref:Ribosomal protein S21 n=1 Tax=Castilleja foliolosa TaxID=1961234 RepID=A0ABD3D6X4_9LAMI
MAVSVTSSIANLFSFFTPSPSTPPPKSPPSHLPLSSSTATNTDRWAPLISSNETQPHSLSCSSSSETMSVICPSLAYANTLFFRSAYNVQVIVDDNEPEERLLGRFRREVMRAGIIQETKRRRYFENKQEEKKRRTRDAAKRNRRRRPQSRFGPPEKSEDSNKKKNDDDEDNWDLPEGDQLPK